MWVFDARSGILINSRIIITKKISKDDLNNIFLKNAGSHILQKRLTKVWSIQQKNKFTKLGQNLKKKVSKRGGDFKN